MSIRAIPLVAVAAAAVALLPATAGAKVIESASVCGADGCKEVAVKGDAHALLEGGATSAKPPEAAPFYRFEIGVGDGSGKVFETFTVDYVPSAAQLRSVDGSWMDALPSTVKAMDAAARGLAPMPAAKLKLAVPPPEVAGTSLPPEVVNAPVASAGDDGGTPAWLVVILAGGGLGAVLGGVLLALRRRMGGGPRPVVAP